MKNTLHTAPAMHGRAAEDTPLPEADVRVRPRYTKPLSQDEKQYLDALYAPPDPDAGTPRRLPLQSTV